MNPAPDSNSERTIKKPKMSATINPAQNPDARRPRENPASTRSPHCFSQPKKDKQEKKEIKGHPKYSSLQAATTRWHLRILTLNNSPASQRRVWQ
ncbi:hypothetical protein VTH06DRAFT_5640 [Thermothelomyces fergusii]